MNEIDELIDWSAVVKLLDRIYGSDEGRPSYPLLTYVNRLLLQQWYGLSDPGLEEAVDDRLSFRRFAGLPLDENVPDHSTIWRFRQELAAFAASATSGCPATPAISTCCAPPSISSVPWRLPHDVQSPPEAS